MPATPPPAATCASFKTWPKATAQRDGPAEAASVVNATIYATLASGGGFDLQARTLAEYGHLDHLAPVEVAPAEARQDTHGEEAEDGAGRAEADRRRGEEEEGRHVGRDAAEGVAEDEAGPAQLVLDRAAEEQQ